jgi:hypothetical protein
MKKVVFFLLLSVVLFSQVVSGSFRGTRSALLTPQTIDHGGRIESRYDGFNHETVITLQKMRVTCGGGKGFGTTLKDICVSVGASLHAPGKQLDYVRYATLQLIFETKNWDQRHSLTQRDLAVVANGETLRLGRMVLVKQDVDTDRLIDVMKEILEVSVPYETFTKIARADFVEIRVGNSEFALQERNLAALKDLNNRVKF